MTAIQHTFAVPLGSTIAQACVALTAEAARTGAIYTAKFNDKQLVAGPDCDPVALVEAFWVATTTRERFVATPQKLSERLIAEASALSARCIELHVTKGSA